MKYELDAERFKERFVRANGFEPEETLLSQIASQMEIYEKIFECAQNGYSLDDIFPVKAVQS